MKIFSAAQVRACDAYTIKAAGIRSIDLMERAALRYVEWITNEVPKETLFVILCGAGNNGGDGFAIARMLHRRGYGVKAFLLQTSADLSPDCNVNYQQLLLAGADLVATISPGTFITDIPPNIVLVDAILGTGLNRPVSGWLESFIRHINSLPNRKIAIDIPSGLSADTLPSPADLAIQASDTLSFQFYKRSFLHPEAAPYTGAIHILDIGLDKTFIAATHTQYCTLSISDGAGMYKPRHAFAHKGNFGHVLLAGGQYGKVGAMVLASRAALRSGAGLVTALLPACGYNVIQTAAPEVMCLTNGDRELNSLTGWEKADAIAIGPGMGTEDNTTDALAAFLDVCTSPVVLDADALNIIAKRPDLLNKIPKDSILTPHPKEFSRIFGQNTNSMVQVDNARIQAMRYGINIVLKGHHTAVADADGDCTYNMTGNAGMATAGAGDVLTGIIAGLLAQGYAPRVAARFGVLLHGCAGDLAAREMSQDALVASDIIDRVGNAYLSL